MPTPSLNRNIRTLFVLGLALCSVACQSSTYRMRYSPSIAEVLLTENPDQPELARVLASVPGAVRAGEERDGDFEMQLRLRIENRSDEEIRLDMSEWLLVDADLDTYGPGRVFEGIEADAPVVVTAGESAQFDLRFPLPSGVRHPRTMNLDGLNLRGVLYLGDGTWPLGMSFSREPLVLYADPYYGRGYYGAGYYGAYGYPGFYGSYCYRY